MFNPEKFRTFTLEDHYSKREG